MAKNTICLWYNGDAEAAARFYAETFPDSTVGAVHRAPSDYPSGKKGDVLLVEFSVAGVACVGLNGGPMFRHNEAFSFQIATDDQAETDRYWNAIVGNGGAESACGWCKDKWGLSWQITPRVLTEAMARGGDVAKRAFEAMMEMQKIDVAKIEAGMLALARRRLRQLLEAHRDGPPVAHLPAQAETLAVEGLGARMVAVVALDVAHGAQCVQEAIGIAQLAADRQLLFEERPRRPP